MKKQRRLIVMEFKKMAALLVEEEQRLLQALRQEEQDTTARLQESMVALEQQSCSLETLLLQLEDCSTWEPLQMLQVRLTCSPGWVDTHSGPDVVDLPGQIQTNREGSVFISSGCVTNTTAWGLNHLFLSLKAGRLVLRRPLSLMCADAISSLHLHMVVLSAAVLL